MKRNTQADSFFGAILALFLRPLLFPFSLSLDSQAINKNWQHNDYNWVKWKKKMQWNKTQQAMFCTEDLCESQLQLFGRCNHISPKKKKEVTLPTSFCSCIPTGKYMVGVIAEQHIHLVIQWLVVQKQVDLHIAFALSLPVHHHSLFPV